MQYHPKLKKAAAEIKAILDKYDIAGVVQLHTPGHGEYVVKINPSYSCAFLEQNGESVMLRVRARVKEDFNGDAKAQQQKVVDTVNMFSILSDMTGINAMSLIEMSKLVDKKTQAEHSDGDHTSHTQQNN